MKLEKDVEIADERRRIRRGGWAAGGEYDQNTLQ